MNPTLTAGSFSAALTGYRPRPGVFDEAVDGDKLRPQWLSFIRHMDQMSLTELQHRWEQAQKQIVNDGMSVLPTDLQTGKVRPWTLDAVPLLVEPVCWKLVSEGLVQRAELYEFILADLFGPQHLLRERFLPPDVLYGHPGFCPAYHGLVPADQKYLQLFAADLARAPNGTWWATGDRTRAPFGLGYLLENRIITSRNLPVPFRNCRVQRLAPFFIALQETLRSLAPRFRDNPRMVLWTNGPSSHSYVEDTYLARYLGYTLAEGDDLAVRENRVMLKTLGGLLPVEVLFRRLDDDDCDPVELSPDSVKGISGLVEVVRSREVAVCNALGSRLVESPIFLPYTAEICRRFLGKELLIPSLATWWCGEPQSLSHVLDNIQNLLIRPAYRTFDSPAIHPGQLSATERQNLVERIRAQPSHFVAQELIERSTAPILIDGELRPWSIALRGFVVAKGDGHLALPSALARVASNPLELDQQMTSGDRSQDVWVLSEKPVEEVSLLKVDSKAVTLRRSGDDFPSRVADNLFWLGRNIERAEAQARLLRTTLLRLTDERERVAELPILMRALAERGQIEPDYVIEGLQQRMPNASEMLPESVFDASQSLSLRATVNEIVRIASSVRDRVAIDMWRIIRRIDEASQRPLHRRSVDAADAIQVLDRVITELVALAGLAAESMTRTQAWRFLELGRRIERAWQTTALCRAMLTRRHEEERAVLEAVLVTIDSIMTYRSRYLASVQAAPVLDLVLTDETNPRSIGYQLTTIMNHVDCLPHDVRHAERSAEHRLALTLQNMVRLANVHALERTDSMGQRPALIRLLDKLGELLPNLSDAISGKFLIHVGQQRHYAMGSI